MKNFVRMNYILKTFVTIVIIFSLVTNVVHARPAKGIISRQKRGSDQRIAELETLLGLEKMRGKLVRVPIGFGRVDPLRIGRKRRSNMKYDLEKIQRILQEVASDSAPVSEENDGILTYSWQDGDTRGDDTETQLI